MQHYPWRLFHGPRSPATLVDPVGFPPPVLGKKSVPIIQFRSLLYSARADERQGNRRLCVFVERVA